MERRTARRLLTAAVVAALTVPVGADAALTLRGVDASGFPTVRVTVVSPTAASAPPTVTENGRQVVGLHAVNLATAKSVVVAIDRSRSMTGAKLDEARSGGQFLAAKSPSDRVAVVAFGSRAVQQSPFSTSTTEQTTRFARSRSTEQRDGAVRRAELSANALGNQDGRSAWSSCSPTARMSRARSRWPTPSRRRTRQPRSSTRSRSAATRPLPRHCGKSRARPAEASSPPRPVRRSRRSTRRSPVSSGAPGASSTSRPPARGATPPAGVAEPGSAASTNFTVPGDVQVPDVYGSHSLAARLAFRRARADDARRLPGATRPGSSSPRRRGRG